MINQVAFCERGKTHESAGVVVPDSLGIPEGLQQRVGLQDNVLDVLSPQTDQGLGRCKRCHTVQSPVFPEDLVSECGQGDRPQNRMSLWFLEH